MINPSREELATALRAAGAAHHDYEVNVLQGERDEQWAGWYAAYLLGRLGGFVTPTTLTGWLTSAPTSEDWANSAADHIEECLRAT